MEKEQFLSLYLHFPFCVRKCRYCDFLSFPEGEDVREAYVRRLLDEIRLRGEELAGRRVRTIFIGGGTPSLMNVSQLDRIMDRIRQSFSVEKEAEISMECNPGTELTFSDLLRCGINRLSLGLQSADDEQLRLLGRIHDWKSFLSTYQAARSAGFSNINIDLMSGLPGQTPASWLQTLQKVSALGPEHISAYSLIIEEGTPFWEIYGENEDDPDPQTGKGMQERGGNPGSGSAIAWPSLPDEDAERQMYADTQDFLGEAGYEHYEISNYARPRYECRHNLTYWYRGDYLGLGLGAASLVDERRFSNCADLQAYLQGSISEGWGEADLNEGLKLRIRPVRDLPALSIEEQMEETMFLGLRCSTGVGKEAFACRFGRKMDDIYGDVIRKYISAGLLEDTGSRIRLTREGISVSNYVMADFLLS